MSATAPWWALPATSVVSLFLGHVLTMWTNRLRRAEQRADRWDPDKMDILSELARAGDHLLALPVWPADVTGLPEPPRPLADTIDELATRYAVRAPAAVAGLARQAKSKAEQLAATIEDIRASTTRGPHGSMDEAVAGRHRQVADGFADALDRFVAAARRDLGITEPYASRRGAAAR